MLEDAVDFTLHRTSRVKPIIKAHLGSMVQWRWEAYSFKLNIGATKLL